MKNVPSRGAASLFFRGSKSKSKSRAGAPDVRGSHFSQRTREMGHPRRFWRQEINVQNQRQRSALQAAQGWGSLGGSWDRKSKSKINVKGNGQECLFHMCTACTMVTMWGGFGRTLGLGSARI
jgi:hypothetical protein